MELIDPIDRAPDRLRRGLGDRLAGEDGVEGFAQVGMGRLVARLSEILDAVVDAAEVQDVPLRVSTAACGVTVAFASLIKTCRGRASGERCSGTPGRI